MNCVFCNKICSRRGFNYGCDCDNGLLIKVDHNNNIIFWDIYININDKRMILESSKVLNHRTELSVNSETLIVINNYTELVSGDEVYKIANKLYALSHYS